MNEQNLPNMPSAVLREEHRFIKRVLRVLEHLVRRAQRGEGFEAAALRQCVEFFRTYADSCHHAKEELLLFPVLVTRGIPREGGPIGVLLDDHVRAREFVRQMDQALRDFEAGDTAAPGRFQAPAAEYFELLRQHIDREDNVLFYQGDQVMTEQDQESLRAGFLKVCCEEPGGWRHGDLERQAYELERQWIRS